MSLGKPQINIVLVDTLTTAALKNYDIDDKILKIYTSGKQQNFNDDIKNIEEKIGSKLHPLVRDFYKISFTVYFSDLQIRRSDTTSVRSFRILISVSDEQRWNNLKQKLEVTLSILTGDNFEFFFVGSKRKISPFKFQKINTEKVPCLFSGGLDSLSGAKWLLDQKKDPILISHCSLPIACKGQTTLSQKLSEIIGRNLEFCQINCKPRKGKGVKQKETSQLSRSFLFLALGCMFALQRGIENVYMCENGILALNFPISNSRIFTNTRTAYPPFIEKYNGLLQAIFGDSITVLNPFMTKTKGETISVLNDVNYVNLVGTAVSCSQTGALRYEKIKISEVQHCGSCYPCFLRQVSIHATNL